MNWVLVSACFVVAFTLVAAGMHPLLRLLQDKAILDHPNERSSHHAPTPKGAGLLLVPVVSALWVLFCVAFDSAGITTDIASMATLAVLLCGFSWLDDLRGLPALYRLGVHVVVAGIGIWLLPGDALVFQGLVPPLADHVLAVIFWVWFINLFNFMDGIDGISGIQTVGICLGIFAVFAVSDTDVVDVYFAVILAGGAIGFLLWNWHPARIFLGDAGSAPLGFMLGWLLIRLACSGEWEAAAILPLYYVADTTVTLLKRLFRGEKIWQAHCQHFYQQATQNGRSHSSVTTAVIGINFCLIALALLASAYLPIIGLSGAVLLVICFLSYLSNARGSSGE